jgi:hypothetical protein
MGQIFVDWIGIKATPMKLGIGAPPVYDCWLYFAIAFFSIGIINRRRKKFK